MVVGRNKAYTGAKRDQSTVIGCIPMESNWGRSLVDVWVRRVQTRQWRVVGESERFDGVFGEVGAQMSDVDVSPLVSALLLRLYRAACWFGGR